MFESTRYPCDRRAYKGFKNLVAQQLVHNNLIPLTSFFNISSTLLIFFTIFKQRCWIEATTWTWMHHFDNLMISEKLKLTNNQFSNKRTQTRWEHLSINPVSWYFAQRFWMLLTGLCTWPIFITLCAIWLTFPQIQYVLRS
jgi:hypothetical protein